MGRDCSSVAQEDMEEACAEMANYFPKAKLRDLQILCILWAHRNRVMSYQKLNAEIRRFILTKPDVEDIKKMVSRLHAVLATTDYPLKITNRAKIGYLLEVPAGWQAPWEVA